MPEIPETLEAENSTFQLLDWGLLAGAAGIWGASFFFIDIGLEVFAPGLITFFRIAFGCITLWLIPIKGPKIEQADRQKVMMLGVTWMAFPLSMFPIAQQWINSSMTGMLNSAMPVLTVLVGLTMFKIPTATIQLFGVATGLAGLFLIGIPEVTTDGTNAIGVLLVVLAVLSYSVAVHIAGPLQRKYGAIPVVRNALLFAVILSIPYGIVGVTDSGFAWGPMIACIALGAGGTGIAYALAAELNGRVGAVRTSIVTYLIPIIAVFLGVLFRDDSITIWAVIGTAVVLLGAFLTTLTQKTGS
jgi:drug/metabolite transporter (DMT)-like permease